MSLYKKAFEQSCDALVVIDALSDKIVELNSKAEELAGRARTELIGQPFRVVFFSSLRDATSKMMQQALNSQEVCSTEMAIQPPDKETILVRASAISLFAEDANCVCLSFGEFSIGSSPGGSSTLSALIKQQAWEIDGLQSQMVKMEKMASLGGLVAGVAHEINTPLGALRSNADTFLRLVKKIRDMLVERKRTDDAELLDLLDKIEEPAQVSDTAAERIVRIVNSLRNYARIDKSEMELSDIHEGIESTLTLVHHELKNRIEVRKEFAPLPPIRCYPNQLNQVFLNLLVNASHAIGNKGEINIQTRQVDERRICVAIADTGSGIQPELIEKIFTPGFTTKGPEHGTGLGLSIVHQIVEQHHGQISIESEVGRGTTVTVLLPIEQPE